MLSPVNVNSAYLILLCTKQKYTYITVSHLLPGGILKILLQMSFGFLIVLPENSVCYKPYKEQLVQSHLGISLSDSVSTVLASDKAPTCIPPGSDGDIV